MMTNQNTHGIRGGVLGNENAEKLVKVSAKRPISLSPVTALQGAFAGRDTQPCQHGDATGEGLGAERRVT